MKKIKVYSRIAGIMNLLYAIALTGVIVFAIIATISAFNGIDDTEGLAALGAAFGAIIVMAITIVATLVALVPCVLLWISSIGLIRTGKKVKKRPASYAVMSIVIHSILLAGGVIGIIALLVGGQAGIVAIVGAALLLSVVNIILCTKIKSKLRLLPKDGETEEPVA